MKLFLWLSGMTIVGFIVYSMFGMQVRIINNCAMKLYLMICNDTEYWYPESCKSYFKKVKRRNRVLILLLALLVLFFVPLIGAIGFGIGFCVAWITTRKFTGLTEDNIRETIKIFMRFVKPGKEDEFEEGLATVAMQAKMESIFDLT